MLALLQQNKQEEALSHALLAVYLYPEDAGCLLNAQVAATACGYGAYDIEVQLDVLVMEARDLSVGQVLSSSDTTNGLKHLSGYYQYNLAWNLIETEMHAALNPSDDSAFDMAPIDVYYELHGLLETVNRGIPGGDEDVEALLAYTEGVGTQLDLR